MSYREPSMSYYEPPNDYNDPAEDDHLRRKMMFKILDELNAYLLDKDYRFSTCDLFNKFDSAFEEIISKRCREEVKDSADQYRIDAYEANRERFDFYY